MSSHNFWTDVSLLVTGVPKYMTINRPLKIRLTFLIKVSKKEVYVLWAFKKVVFHLFNFTPDGYNINYIEFFFLNMEFGQISQHLGQFCRFKKSRDHSLEIPRLSYVGVNLVDKTMPRETKTIKESSLNSHVYWVTLYYILASSFMKN